MALYGLASKHFKRAGLFLPSQNLPRRCDTTSEHIYNHIALHNRLLDDALDVLWLNPAIPDPVPSEWMPLSIARLHRQRQVDDDIARELVSSDVGDQTHPRSQVRPSSRPGYRRQPVLAIKLHPHRPAQDLDALPRQLHLELVPQRGAHDAAAHVAAAVAAREHQDVVYVAHADELRAEGRLARQPVAVDGRQAVVHGVEPLGQQVAPRQGLDGAEGDARQGGHVLEAGKQVRRGVDEVHEPRDWGGREGGVEDGDVVEGL